MSDRPRIAIIDPVGIKAGMDEYDMGLADALVKKGAEVFVFSNFVVENSRASVFNSFRFTFSKGPLQVFRLPAEYTSSINKSLKYRCNWVILHVFHFSLADRLFIRIAQLRGMKCALIIHDAEGLVAGRRTHRLNACCNTADLLIVHNNFSREELDKLTGGRFKDKMHIVPHGAEVAGRNSQRRDYGIDYFNLNASMHYLLMFGMLKKSKSPGLLLKAMKELPGNIHVIIAGRERDLTGAELERTAMEYGLGDRVHVLPRYITNSERNLLFCLCDIVVLPYSKIYQSGVLLLAMCHGIPVIASDLPSNREVINNRNGVLFITGDSSDLSEKIGKLVNDKQGMNNLAANALEFIKLHHNWDMIASKWLQLLNPEK